MKITDFAIKGTKLPMIPNGTYYTTTHWSRSNFNTIREDKEDLISYGSVNHCGVYYILAEIEGYKGTAPFCIMGADILSLAKKQGMIGGGKLIGYKCPMELGSLNIPKGSVFIPHSTHVGWYKLKVGNFGLPHEIVETWEAVYEETSMTIILDGIEVTINKKGVFVEDVKLNIDDIRNLLLSSTSRITRIRSNLSHEPYQVELLDATYKIGCSEFKLNDLQNVVKTYDEINATS